MPIFFSTCEFLVMNFQILSKDGSTFFLSQDDASNCLWLFQGSGCGQTFKVASLMFCVYGKLWNNNVIGNKKLINLLLYIRCVSCSDGAKSQF